MFAFHVCCNGICRVGVHCSFDMQDMKLYMQVRIVKLVPPASVLAMDSSCYIHETHTHMLNIDRRLPLYDRVIGAMLLILIGGCHFMIELLEPCS